MSVESKTLKNPVKSLDGILSGLAKTLTKLQAAEQAVGTYVATREAQIAQLEQEKKTAESVAARASKVSANLKELLAID